MPNKCVSIKIKSQFMLENYQLIASRLSIENDTMIVLKIEWMS